MNSPFDRDVDFEHWADSLRASENARVRRGRVMAAALLTLGMIALVIGAMLAGGLR